MNCRKAAFLLLAAVSFIFAQDSETLNIFASLGFGFPTGGQVFSSHTYDDVALSEREDKYFNYGQGIKFDAGIQYFMMENVALQAAFGYSGRIPKLKIRDINRDINNVVNTTIRDSSINYSSSLFGLKVLVVPRFEILELLNMYTGVGIGFFWNSLSYEASRLAGTDVVNYEGKIKSSPALGLLGLMGIDIPLSDLMTAFGEVAFEQMSFKWRKRIEEGRYTIVYEKDANTVDAPQRIPGSNWQIRAGIRFIAF